MTTDQSSEYSTQLMKLSDNELRNEMVRVSYRQWRHDLVKSEVTRRKLPLEFFTNEDPRQLPSYNRSV